MTEPRLGSHVTGREAGACALAHGVPAHRLLWRAECPRAALKPEHTSERHLLQKVQEWRSERPWLHAEHMAGAVWNTDRTVPTPQFDGSGLQEHRMLYLLGKVSAQVMVRQGWRKTTNTVPGSAQVPTSPLFIPGKSPLHPTVFSSCQSNLLVIRNEQVFYLKCGR